MSTVLFALIDGVVLRPLPYPDAETLVAISDTNPSLGLDRTGVASGNIDDWRRGASGFDGIAGYYAMGRTVSADTDADVVLTAQVSADFFPLIRVPALVGRTFTEADTRASQFNTANAPIGADPVVIIGHDLWQRRFGGDPDVTGRAINLERRSFRVVGVMPPGFALPEAAVQAWIPWDLSGERARDQHYLGAIGRLRPEVSVGQAGQELNTGRRHPRTPVAGDQRGVGRRSGPPGDRASTVCGSGLLVRSFLALRVADPGFTPAGVLVAPIFLDS